MVEVKASSQQKEYIPRVPFAEMHKIKYSIYTQLPIHLIKLIIIAAMYIYITFGEIYLNQLLTISQKCKYLKVTIPGKNLFNSRRAMNTSKWLTGPQNTIANIYMARTNNTNLILNIVFTRKSFLFKCRADHSKYTPFSMSILV